MLIQSSTLWSQDSVRVAYSDLKEILILASKGEKLDSLVSAYELQIEIKEGKITLREDQLLLSEELIEEQGNLINSQASEIEKLERKRKNLRTAVIGLTIGVIFETFIILK